MHESSGPKPATTRMQHSGIEWSKTTWGHLRGYVERKCLDSWQYVIYEHPNSWEVDTDSTGKAWDRLGLCFSTLEEAKQWCEIHWITVGFQG